MSDIFIERITPAAGGSMQHYRVWIETEGGLPLVGNFEASSFDDAADQAEAEAREYHCTHEGSCSPSCVLVKKIARIFSDRPNSYALG